MDLILIERPRPDILRIVMNRPERRHAVTPELRAQILDAMKAGEVDPSVRAIILTGSGGHFSGGGDIERISGLTEADIPDYMKGLRRFIVALGNCTKPLVAAVQGVAAGGGAGFALACDFIVMGRGATFVFPFFRIGLIPDAGILHHLPRRVGLAMARQLLFIDQRVDGARSERIGLADFVTDDARVQEEAVELATKLARHPPQAFGLTKAILSGEGQSLSEILVAEAKAQQLCLQSEQFKDGVAAFMKKGEGR
ncbi:enoyl-CoA hydratase/isomerase family protein [Pseudorhodoplanes sp.]|uniref:enoyl-CoA hydratase/isomerase family protein n=1 Tax=Pseudorhodoplanes sp. TaxID=1934341 RepID=UPI003D115459